MALGQPPQCPQQICSQETNWVSESGRTVGLPLCSKVLGWQPCGSLKSPLCFIQLRLHPVHRAWECAIGCSCSSHCQYFSPSSHALTCTVTNSRVHISPTVLLRLWSWHVPSNWSLGFVTLPESVPFPCTSTSLLFHTHRNGVSALFFWSSFLDEFWSHLFTVLLPSVSLLPLSFLDLLASATDF